MALKTRYSDTRLEITFSSSDFLKEAITDFLESGAEASRIASAIIKVATGVELLLKDNLERVCPALVLDKLDDSGLQVAKIFGLGRRMRLPKELDTVELRTAAFPVLLIRTATFFDITAAAPHLHKLHKIRNSLIHHRGTVDVLEANLLLVQHIFPFIEQMSKSDKTRGQLISDDVWKKIHELEKFSVDVLSSQLAKNIAHHAEAAQRLSPERIALLAGSNPETTTRDETVGEDKLTCPACKNETLAAFQDIDVDFDEGGPVAGHFIFSMRCRVCDLDLDESEIAHIIANFKEYVGENKEKEKEQWELAIEPDIPDDRY